MWTLAKDYSVFVAWMLLLDVSSSFLDLLMRATVVSAGEKKTIVGSSRHHNRIYLIESTVQTHVSIQSRAILKGSLADVAFNTFRLVKAKDRTKSAQTNRRISDHLRVCCSSPRTAGRSAGVGIVERARRTALH